MTAIQPTLDGTTEPASRRRAETYAAWIAEVRPVFERVAREGYRFTSFEIADRHNLPDPPNPKSHWGTFVHLLREEGWIEHVAYEDTVRPGGRRSGVKVWRGTRQARRAAA